MTSEERQLIEEIRDAIHKQGERVRRIERVLIGDKEYRVKGVVDIIEEHEQHVQKNKIERAKLIGFSVGSGAAGGGIIAYLKSLFS